MAVNHELFMRRALQLAANGRGFTSPNPMVGAVIVGADGSIIGEGWHRKFGGPHAEVNAVNSVADPTLLTDATLYVTLEPCSHYGKTPPCAELIIRCRIPRVVVGCTDPNPRVAGRGIAMLRKAGIHVEVGCLEQECIALNRYFITAQSLHRPYILLKWAMSSDGYLDSDRQPTDPAPKFSTPQSLMLMHRLRSEFDAIMVGANTVERDNPSLTTRLYPGRSPRAVVMGSSTHTPPPSSAVAQRADTILLTGLTAVEAVKQLSDQSIISLMVEGGPTLLESFLNESLWDEARIEISPTCLNTANPALKMTIPQGITTTSQIGRNIIINVKNPNPLHF